VISPGGASPPRVSVIGSGYVGTVVGACLAALGRQLTALETDRAKLSSLQKGHVPFYEPGLPELVRAGLEEGRLRFTGDVSGAMAASDVVFLCVGTPPGSDGHADMTQVVAAAEAIGRCLDRHHVLVTKSTVPIGSGQWLASMVEDALPPHVSVDQVLSVVSCPEFLREGNAIADFLHPDRVVLGSDDPRAIDVVAEVYRPILEQSFADGEAAGRRPALVRTTLATAETVKYASNAFLATKISFVNEIANICEMVGADVTEVATALGLDDRIGGRFLSAGAGWGGSCLGKDLGALVSTASDHGYRPQLLEAVLAVNERQRRLVVEKLRRHLKTLQGRRVGLLGLAFKPGTDDTRDAPAVDVAAWLSTAGALITAHDPMARGVPALPGLRLAGDPYQAAAKADAVVLMTEWPEYHNLDLDTLRAVMRGRLIVDARNALDPAAAVDAGFRYEGVGRTVPPGEAWASGRPGAVGRTAPGMPSPAIGHERDDPHPAPAP
jgi:UDPglucose 6-dehydrogenase